MGCHILCLVNDYKIPLVMLQIERDSCFSLIDNIDNNGNIGIRGFTT